MTAATLNAALPRRASQARERVPQRVHVERAHASARDELHPDVAPYVAGVHGRPVSVANTRCLAVSAGEFLMSLQDFDEPPPIARLLGIETLERPEAQHVLRSITSRSTTEKNSTALRTRMIRFTSSVLEPLSMTSIPTSMRSRNNSCSPD